MIVCGARGLESISAEALYLAAFLSLNLVFKL